MTLDPRHDPLSIYPSITEGDVLTTTGGVAAWHAPAAPPAPPTPLVSVVSGVPGLVFDDDGSIVYRQVSP